MDPVRLVVLTVSDAASRGDRQDTSGDAIMAWADRNGHRVVAREVVPDDMDRIADRLATHADSGTADVILTTGGTGFTERDVTPEATLRVIQRHAPGLAETLRIEGARSTPYSWLSRGVSGIRARTLMLNLPGSTGGVRDGLAILEPLIRHAVQLLRGTETHRHPDHG